LVLLGERDVPERFDHIRLANEEGARLATTHMIQRGSRRIVALGCAFESAHTMAGDRRRGWELAHQEAGIRVDRELVVPVSTYSHEAARAALDAVLASGLSFDGVFAATDVLALGALAALADHRRRVPEDVQLAGFDNLDISR